MKMRNRIERLTKRKEAYSNTLARAKGTAINSDNFHRPGSLKK